MGKLSKMHAALRSFSQVQAIYRGGWMDGVHQDYAYAAIMFEVPSGRPPAYHVYRLDLVKHTISLIGNELPLKTAQAVARRRIERDGEPLSQDELRIGRWARTRWNYLTTNGRRPSTNLKGESIVD